MVAAANHNNINKIKTTTKTQSPIFLKNKWKKIIQKKEEVSWDNSARKKVGNNSSKKECALTKETKFLHLRW